MRHKGQQGSPGALGSAEAARLLGCTPRHVARLCQEGHIPAYKEDDTWHIGPEALARFRRRPPGRPRTLQPSPAVLRRRVRYAERHRRAQERACAS